MTISITAFPIPANPISALVSITAGGSPASQPSSGDLLPFVRVSDATQSPSGSTKKMTVGQLFTSPSFTGNGEFQGNLQVDGATTLAATNITALSASLAATITRNVVGASSFLQLTGNGSAGVGILGKDASNNLLIERGSDGATALSIDRTTGITSSPLGILVNAPTAAGIGYGTGAGSSVTQITSATTSVTLNTLCGQITTVAQNLVAGAIASFTFTNSTIAATDLVHVLLKSGQNITGTWARARAFAAGSCIIDVISGGTTETGVLVLNFYVAKSVIV